MSWYLKVMKNFATFSGRARRMEYWMFVLFNILVAVALVFVDSMVGTFNESTGSGLLSGIYSLIVILPSIAVAVRRLHDTDRSGWWLLLLFLPVIGALVLLVFMVLDGTQGDNRFGPSPK